MKIQIILLILLISGCGKMPADPNKSFERSKETGLRVGFTANPPWVIENNGEAEGIEPEIIKQFAGTNGIKIIWENGSEQELLKKLEKKELQLVLGGFLSDTPWKSEKVGFTRPYFKNGKEKRVIAIQQGENKLLFNIEKHFEDQKNDIIEMTDRNLRSN